LRGGQQRDSGHRDLGDDKLPRINTGLEEIIEAEEADGRYQAVQSLQKSERTNWIRTGGRRNMMKTSAASVIAANDRVTPEAEPDGKNSEGDENGFFEALFHTLHCKPRQRSAGKVQGAVTEDEAPIHGFSNHNACQFFGGLA